MKKVYVIFSREFKGYFNSPIAYIFISFFLGITSVFFMLDFFLRNTADMRSYFERHLPLFLLFFVPAISMRLWAEEKRQGTLELLMTLPFKTWELVLGKFLAGYLFLTVSILLSCPIPLTIALLGNPDWGPILGGYCGIILMGGVYLALGAFISGVTRNQIIAFVISITLCFCLFIIGSPGVVAFMGNIWLPLANLCGILSITTHFEGFERGVIDTSNLIYFGSAMALFLFLNYFSIEKTKY